VVRSPGLALGYHGGGDRAAAARPALVGADGFYRTGDLGRLDEVGYLEILGRKRDVFSTPEGTNIYPERIEAALESLDGVEQALVLGDGRGYVTAHLVVRDRVPAGAGAVAERAIDGELEAGLYERLGEALQALNETLELVEQVVAFALYPRPFPDSAYRVVAGAKVARDRRAFAAEFGAVVELLYSRQLAADSPMLVPPKERRFFDRVSRRMRRLSGDVLAAAERAPAQAPADSDG
jgi:long-chain acyl-CoA synthetase